MEIANSVGCRTKVTKSADVVPGNLASIRVRSSPGGGVDRKRFGLRKSQGVLSRPRSHPRRITLVSGGTPLHGTRGPAADGAWPYIASALKLYLHRGCRTRVPPERGPRRPRTATERVQVALPPAPASSLRATRGSRASARRRRDGPLQAPRPADERVRTTRGSLPRLQFLHPRAARVNQVPPEPATHTQRRAITETRPGGHDPKLRNDAANPRRACPRDVDPEHVSRLARRHLPRHHLRKEDHQPDPRHARRSR